MSLDLSRAGFVVDGMDTKDARVTDECRIFVTVKNAPGAHSTCIADWNFALTSLMTWPRQWLSLRADLANANKATEEMKAERDGALAALAESRRLSAENLREGEGLATARKTLEEQRAIWAAASNEASANHRRIERDLIAQRDAALADLKKARECSDSNRSIAHEQGQEILKLRERVRDLERRPDVWVEPATMQREVDRRASEERVNRLVDEKKSVRHTLVCAMPNMDGMASVDIITQLVKERDALRARVAKLEAQVDPIAYAKASSERMAAFDKMKAECDKAKADARLSEAERDNAFTMTRHVESICAAKQAYIDKIEGELREVRDKCSQVRERIRSAVEDALK